MSRQSDALRDLAPALLGFDSCLMLEDGRVFLGRGFGAPRDAEGEVVFNTSMAGYQEIATDPSYHGQMVVLTHPQIGNYGAQLEAAESRRPWVAALIVRDLARHPNHWASHTRLDELLAAEGVPGIEGVDTRALTRHLRMHGTKRAVLRRVNLAAGPLDHGELARAAGSVVPLTQKNLVGEASGPTLLDARTARATARAGDRAALHVALIDCGVKHNIVRSLVARNVRLTALPWNADIDAVLATGAQGVVISNGPGDPESVNPTVVLAKELLRRAIPTLGICLGHQVIGLAAGGTTSRLKYGHHGGNHPVRDLVRQQVHITSQNHEFQVDAASIPAASGLSVSMVNLNDGSVEGLAHHELPVFSVQYHPEACPGPEDNQYIFECFLDMVARPVAGRGALGGHTSAVGGGA